MFGCLGGAFGRWLRRLVAANLEMVDPSFDRLLLPGWGGRGCLPTCPATCCLPASAIIARRSVLVPRRVAIAAQQDPGRCAEVALVVNCKVNSSVLPS